MRGITTFQRTSSLFTTPPEVKNDNSLTMEDGGYLEIFQTELLYGNNITIPLQGGYADNICNNIIFSIFNGLILFIFDPYLHVNYFLHV